MRSFLRRIGLGGHPCRVADPFRPLLRWPLCGQLRSTQNGSFDVCRPWVAQRLTPPRHPRASDICTPRHSCPPWQLRSSCHKQDMVVAKATPTAPFGSLSCHPSGSLRNPARGRLHIGSFSADMRGGFAAPTRRKRYQRFRRSPAPRHLADAEGRGCAPFAPV